MTTKEKSNPLLPATPHNLCFDKNVFMKKDFKVDQFVAECRRHVQLEVLRQDLEVYFKLLKNAMIVLINKDYADFVNLSSNLVGMDKAIVQLREPLQQMQSYVKSIQDEMRQKCSEFSKELEEQQALSEKQNLLNHMMRLLNAVEKIEQIQASSEADSGQCLERMASEFNQLQYHASYCKRLPVLNQIRPRIAEITSNLQQSLEYVLLQGISDGDSTVVHRCLNSYALISKSKDAEKLVQTHVVHPLMQQIMEDQSTDESPQMLKAFFDRVLDVCPQYIKMLCDVTSGRCSSLGEQYRGISGFDFMVNAVWPEVATTMEKSMSNVFSPANPDLFHKRYKICMNFVSSFEIQCRSQASVQRLRQSEAFSRFLAHWSLPVYFQIRFQEIGRKLEQALLTSTNKNTTNNDGIFRLHGTQNLYDCVLKCWDNHVFLSPLVHRFWKVTLQLISRFHTWLKSILSNEKSSTDVPPLTLQQFVSLIHDIAVFNVKVTAIYENKIVPKIKACGVKDTDSHQEALNELLKMYEECATAFTEHVVTTMTSQSCVYLKQVNDVPRLFRRTNREAPTKPSSYVASMMRSAVTFKEENSEYLDEKKHTEMLKTFFCGVSEKYYTVLNDVLTSVRKMEESLQRLQKMRSSGRNSVADVSQAGKMSDDDKIRLQLYLDMKNFGDQMNTLGVKNEEVPKYIELREMVEEAKSNNGNKNGS